MTESGAAPSPISPVARPRRRARRRFWIGLLLALLVSAALYPPAWHLALRQFIAWQASSRGWTVEVGAVEGGLLDATVLHDLRGRKTFPAATVSEKAGGVDLRIARAEAVFAWRLPFTAENGAGWLGCLTLDGLTGAMDFTSAGATERDAAAAAAPPPPRTAGLTPGFVLKLWPLLTAPPANFELLRVDCRVSRGGVSLRAHNARLTAYRDEPGAFLARQMEIAGPGFENTLDNRHGQTAWKDGRLTVGNLSLGPGLDLVRLTVDGARLRKRQLDWDSELHALGGSVRSQGTFRFAHGRIGLDVAGSFQQVAMRPLARMLGVTGETDGVVDQGQFSFRGNPEQWTQATISLAGQASDFRWQQRRWESLDLAMIVLHERLTVRKLDLRQSRNQLKLSGECPLFLNGSDNAWKLLGFTCQVDAKLDDLHSLVELLGLGLPGVSGRMSVNGALASRTQGQGFDGYLNIEGSGLSVANAPLDFLRSTLLFHGEDLEVADLQATRGTDYLSGRGTMRIVGSPRYQGELHAAVADLAMYHPAYAGVWSPEPLQGALRLNWTGDGAPGVHSGAFRGSVANFAAKSGPAHFSRPIALEAEGTYSPDSLSFRRLALKEGPPDKRRDAIKIEGALPWKLDAAAPNARSLDFSRTMALRIACADAPLDLIAEAINAPEPVTAEGQVSGWLDLSGTPQAPHANGVLQFRKAALRWADAPPIEAATADVRIDDSLVRIDNGSGKRLGADWQAAGSIDVHQPAHPLLDLSLRTRRLPLAVDNPVLHADAEVTLSARGPWRQGEISGEVRLLDAVMRKHLETGGEGNASSWVELTSGMPKEWRDDRLALHVTSAKPLRGTLGGEFVPDLTVTGNGGAPQLSGDLELHKVRIATATEGGVIAETGTLYFTAGEPPAMRLLLANGVAVLGSVDSAWSIEPDSEPTSAAELLRHAQAESELTGQEPPPPPVTLTWR